MNYCKNLSRIWLLMGTLFLPTLAQAQLTFTTNYGAITITGCIGPAGTLNIPATTNGYSVTEIGYSAFQSNSTLTSISIPDSVFTIDADAFASCSNLTNVTIGNGLAAIGGSAFLDDVLLPTIKLPDSVSTIPPQLFAGCSSLTNFVIGTNVSEIGGEVFMNCEQLTDITVAPGNSTYSSPNGVLTDIYQTTILEFPCGKAGNYVIPGTITTIDDSAFQRAQRLTGVTIGDSVINIGNLAFANINTLTNVTIGSNVTYIGLAAFASCSALPAITVATNNPAFSSLDGVLFSQDQTTLIEFPGGKAGNYTTPASVTTIGNAAFNGCFNLNNLTVGDSVTSSGFDAFSSCQNLTNVTIGSGVTSIGMGAFDGCYKLTSITVDPLNPTYSSVNGALFNQNQTQLLYCPGGIIGSYTLPASVKAIYGYAFQDNYQLTSVYFTGDAPYVPNTIPIFNEPLTVYYLPGTAGWGTTFAGMTAISWNPQVQTLGLQTNQFGFAITGNSNVVVVVDACTNLAAPDWLPVQTNTLAAGSTYFNDSQWTNYPIRYYRLRSP
jgi:hypothetical protein